MDPKAALAIMRDDGATDDEREEAARAYNRWVRLGGGPVDGVLGVAVYWHHDPRERHGRPRFVERKVQT